MALRTGFVGLGNIGRPMAIRLAERGLAPVVYDVVPEAVATAVAAGASAAADLAEVAHRSDWIGVCVRDDDDVRRVVLDDEGLLPHCTRGTTIAVHSTILPRTVRELVDAAQPRGVDVIDACITGGAGGAAQGTLTIMVGGSDAALERSRPVLELLGTLVVATGEAGTGAATKLCNNLMTYLGFLAAFEADLLARTSGLSAAALDEVTRSNGNLTPQMQSFVLLHRLPQAERDKPEFQEHLRSFTTLAEKDLGVTLAFAREHGVALPGAGLCQQLMARVYGLRDPNRR